MGVLAVFSLHPANKAAAGAAAPLVQQFWLRFSPVLLAQPRLEEFGAVWALENFT